MIVFIVRDKWIYFYVDELLNSSFSNVVRL